MATIAKPEFNAQLMSDDMALKGWTRAELARRAGVADMTVLRFFGGRQNLTPPTAKKLASALGRNIGRYLVSSAENSAVAP
jgi:transcriptional regulator with XRE-family HTH domain